MLKDKYWKRWLYAGLAICLFIISFVCFNIMNSDNTNLNNYLIHTKTHTVKLLDNQHKQYLNYQSQQSILANYHEMYNSFYLEMHPKIKNFRQLARDTKYEKMSNDTTRLNNHDSNEMGELKYNGIIERKHLRHEYRHTVWGNVNNTLNTRTFNRKQYHLKLQVLYVFISLIAGLILVVMAVNYKSHVLHQTANELRIKRMKADAERERKEFGDNNPE